MGGIAEELLRLSVEDVVEDWVEAGIKSVHQCWEQDDETSIEQRKKKRYQSSFNPNSFQMLMEKVLVDEGIEIWYDSRLCQVLKDDDNISHIIVENKSGRLAVKVGAVVDASGDADVCFHAGAPTETSPNNVVAGWYYEASPEKFQLKTFSHKYDPDHYRGQEAEGPFYNGVNHRELTELVLQSRREIYDRIQQSRKVSGENRSFVVGMNSIPDVRVTRWLNNDFTLEEKHRHLWLDDIVGMTGDWRKKGPVYPIPLRSLRCESVPNLFVAGRCISAGHSVTDVTRAIPTCAVTGEASGMAAAMLSLQGHLELQALQQKLRQNGVVLDRHLLERGPSLYQDSVSVSGKPQKIAHL